MKAKRNMIVVVVVLMAVCRLAGATGILLPKDKTLPPLGIKSHRVEVAVRDGVATTRITQVFLNSTKRRLEATYIFPVPADAALTDFAMWINGERQSGQIVEAQKARRVYEDIVRRMRDPGLLEYMDARLLKLRVFPIEPESTQRVEISYASPLPFENGVCRYTFPLKTGEMASKVIEDSTVSVEISDRRPIVNVYSPSHKVGISRKGKHQAIVGFEEEGAMLSKDFVLYYSVGEKDFGLNLITHRVKGEDGYFALMLAPRVDIKEEDIMPKDVCFLVDVSGSMQQQNRIGSAREALKFCLKALRPTDRFAIVPFSTGVDVYGEGLTLADKAGVEAAVAYVEKLDALGGTRLYDAVIKGLAMAPADGKRPYIVVLLTDGKPTLGEFVEPDEIIKGVRAELKREGRAGVRIFPFGIAERLDVPLLDQIAQASRGYSEYVAPGREIETEVSAFFRKVSNPVLSGLKADFGKIKVADMYPEVLPDLFRGSQVLAFGRYSGHGDVAVQLTGVMQGKERTFAYDATFPAEDADGAFIPHLWAQRKIAYLLDGIRLHGESKEVVDEVVRLSKEFGIATPYTSYLVLENAQEYVRHGIVADRAAKKALEAAGPRSAEEPATALRLERRREAGALTLDALAPTVGGESGAAGDADEETRRKADFFGVVGGKGRAGAPATAPARRDGHDAVTLSRALSRLKEAKGAGEGLASREAATIRKVGGRTFARIDGVFVDTAFDAEMDTLKIKWASDAYFALLDAMPELKDALMLGQRLVIVVDGKALIVGDEGEETMDAKAIGEFLGK